MYGLARFIDRFGHKVDCALNQCVCNLDEFGGEPLYGVSGMNETATVEVQDSVRSSSRFRDDARAAVQITSVQHVE